MLTKAKLNGLDNLDDALCVLDSYNKFLHECLEGKYKISDIDTLRARGGLLDQVQDVLIAHVISCAKDILPK